MSLPDGFLDELRTRASLTQVVGKKVVWDNKKSNQGKGDMWAPCPFHHEKTASFHVDDKQGFYYCFGCHAKGDAISFVRETENVGFMEAVEILAREVGMQMPARDPKAQEKSDKRSVLAEICEVALRFFRLSLSQQGGAAARAYLDGRGVSAQMLERFDIGYAPNGNVLLDHLKDQGISEAIAHEAGLAGKPDDGRSMYDFYRDRIMFPIRDARGRVISFGGRAMDPNARAKYLNGPQTLLFDKSTALYNHKDARAATGRSQQLIVAEGYMDVVALTQAGFEAAVAPLGTAVTQTQLQLMWRMSPQPVIALDGDKAGLRAAYRVIDLAMPLLQSGQALSFAVMPEGQDPDELIKAGGAEAMQAQLDVALPTIDLLWRRETEGRAHRTPEQRAALDKALRDAIRPIADPSIKHHYGDILKEMRFQLYRGQSGQGGGGQAGGGSGAGGSGGSGAWNNNNSRGGRSGGGGRRGFGWGKQAEVPTEGLKANPVVNADDAYVDTTREAVVLATVLRNPQLAERFLSQLEALHTNTPAHGAILHAILRYADQPEGLEAAVAEAAGQATLDMLFAHPHVRISPPVRKPDLEIAEVCLTEELAKLKARRGFQAELAEGMADLVEAGDENVTYRLGQVAEARNKATKAEAEDRTEFDTAENGAEIKRDERATFRDLLDRISPDRKG